MTRADPAGSGETGLVAVYYPHRMDMEATLKALSSFVPEDPLRRDSRFFSSWGPGLEPTPDHKPCAHYLTPLDESFRAAFVLKQSIPLPPSSALAAVFGAMLLAMGEGASIYVQSDKTIRRTARWVMPEDLRATLPSAEIEARPGGVNGWFRIGWRKGLTEDVAGLGSIYPLLAHRFGDFHEALIEAGHPDGDPDSDFYNSTVNTFTYSMHWALHTSALLEIIFREHGMTGPMRGLDVGGSYGFLACEMAARGHRMTNLEMLDSGVQRFQPWLAEASGVANLVDGVAARMETLSEKDDRYDFVCFMGSLLCIDRDKVPDVLKAATRQLERGGLVLVRENLLIEATKRTGGPVETRFTPVELNDFLRQNVGDVSYFCHNGFERTFSAVKSLWTVFAAARRPAADTPPGLRGLLKKAASAFPRRCAP